MENDFLLNVFRIVVLISGLWDAEKYETQRSKIVRVKSAKSQSRMFLNKAFVIDVIKLIYVMVLYPHDYVLLIISGLPLITIARLFWITYLFYPYRNRGLLHFHRPSFMIYYINSWLPNRLRKRL